MRFKDYNTIYDILSEAPHIEFAGQLIDLEAEKHQIIPRLIGIIIGRKVNDKYGSEFQLNKKEISKFIDYIKKDTFISRFLDKELLSI